MYRMMIIDDEPIVVEGIRDTIPWQEYQVEVGATANNGLEALEKLGCYQPEIIIVDIRMPGMDGLSFIEQARQLVPKVQFIVISAFEQFAYAQRAIELGVRFYLVKPIQETEIIEKVLQCIAEMDNSGCETTAIPFSAAAGKFPASNWFLEAVADAPPPAQAPETPAEENPFRSRVVRNACRYMDSRAFQDISLIDVAEHVFVTPTYLSALFRQEMGLSFIEYLKKQRIERAKYMLRETNLKVYEICTELGYKSVQYFSTLFRTSVGMTPMEYRESADRPDIP